MWTKPVEKSWQEGQRNLIPRLSRLPGFSGYYLIEAGRGVVTSVSLFDTSDHADESTRLAATWVQDDGLTTALPNPPKITVGKVIAAQRTASASSRLGSL